jgi:hypothetical protein
VAHVDAVVLVKDAQIDFTERLETFAQQDCGVANNLGLMLSNLSRSERQSALTISSLVMP